MRVALGQIPDATPEQLAFARQLGLTGIQVNTPVLPGDSEWAVEDLMALRRRCEDAGLRLEAIENMPDRFYARAMLGTPGRDEDIEHVRTTIRNIGQAGIAILGYHFMPASVWRTSVSRTGRGGAIVTAYDHAVASDPDRQQEVFVARRDQRREDPFIRAAHLDLGEGLDDDAMWSNFRYFLSAIVPVAAEAGVRLALHPDDPPVAELAGMARLFRSVDALRTAMDIVDSPSSGLDLCLGTVSEMGGQDAVLEAIDTFGPAGKIVYVHLRDVIGTVPTFEETFIGAGNYDPVVVLQRLIDVGFDGFIIDDHVPRMVGDSDYMHRGRAHAVGYISGILRALESAGPGPRGG